MDDPTKHFSVWLFRDRDWEDGDSGRRVAFPFDEPAEAADQAEAVLRQSGIAGQSYCELRFNGEDKPHTVICYMGENRFGIWNTDHVKWPIYYPPEGDGVMLGEFPFPDAMDGAQWKDDPEAEQSEKSDEGNMRLDEIESGEDDDDSDEGTEDDEIQEDDSAEDDDGADEDSSDPEDGEDEDEEEDDEDTDEEDESDDGEEDAPQDFSDGEEDGEDEEDEMIPRLRIFAKFRGPIGWRKRAEAEELQDRNTFAVKFGILNEDEEKTAAQEKEVFAHIEFIETDEDRSAGILRIKIPEGVEFSERTKSGWITAAIPYRQGEE